MLNGNFKESHEKTVNIVDFTKEDSQEFLNCCDENQGLRVNETNVLQIVEIADKYQVVQLISTCKLVMENVLTSTVPLHADSLIYANKMLHTLAIASRLQYVDLLELGVTALGKLPSWLYTHNH
ncbi:hypothetical protein DPMN_086597 [Dreissena polymorpha]|uniref:BTB domain-containing protein n=1 Tax=Dreissena polymorpha TaxID=45954 RepID=A0A9D4KRS3_DREPO|nr:hypothetical protein DPMN_086597 [Dreissena polymorpha]